MRVLYRKNLKTVTVLYNTPLKYKSYNRIKPVNRTNKVGKEKKEKDKKVVVTRL